MLSVLGIIIGVGALVTILCMIDGMEKFAKEQIHATTSLNTIAMQSEPTYTSNGISIRKKEFAFLTYHHFKNLEQLLQHDSVKLVLAATSSSEIDNGKEKIPSLLIGCSPITNDKFKLISGKLFTKQHVDSIAHVAVVNQVFVKQFGADESINTPMGRLTITGVIEDNSNKPRIFFPISILSDAQLREQPPEFYAEVANIENVGAIKNKISEWTKSEFKNSASDLKVITNEFRLEQIERGFLLFRIIMGLIVGLSVIVGGIGVMNVLLISVTQRTMEIGVRKAMGAKRSDIILQFLTEAVTISCFGSICGLILGVTFTWAALPIIKSITKVPFQAAYTVNTLFVVSSIAVLVGIIFGTYPALRASRLDPVEAIRRE
jgi:putative ABC transport system permease protein